MFRVLIADDENSVIQSLVDSVSWDELELQVVCTASDGLTALELADQYNVDIAILDIRMPKINGLELCERLRMINEQMQLIIISGYAEFAYAEKAIQYGVLGYCLKPLEYTQITRFLRKAVQNLKNARHLFETEDLLDILERRDRKTIQETLFHLGLSSGKYYIAVSVGEKKVEVLEKAGISVRLGRGQWGYIMKNNRIGQLEKNSDQSTGWKGIGYKMYAVDGEKIYETFEECIAQACQHFVDKENRICCNLDDSKSNDWLNAIQQRIHSNSWNSMITILKEIKTKGKNDFSVRTSVKLCNLIFSTPAFRGEENDYYVYSFEQLVCEYGTFDEMIDTLVKALEDANQTFHNEQMSSNATFMKLMKYINANYKSEISLSSAADALYMNANYLSQLFKKEAGVTFVHYVTQKRLDDAKVLLLTTKKPLTDIALEVGFNDTFHFIKTFKKFVGMPPGQYRSNN